jgi:hypothetical protein
LANGKFVLPFVNVFGSISTAPDAPICGSVVTSDAGLLAYRELDDALSLTEMAGETLADARTGSKGRHALVGLLRQSVFGRLAGYEDVNDACATIRRCAGLSGGQRLTVTQHRRARWAASKLSGSRHLRTSLLLPTCLASGSSSCSPTHGEQEMSVSNGHYACA